MEGPDANKIQSLFSDISKSYDSANDAITFGMARAWRKRLVHLSQAKLGDQILDIATGTGDLAFDFYKLTNKKTNVTGIDFCKPMLDIAIDKAVIKDANIEFKLGDACNLDFNDESFDIVSISYGIRNVQNFDQAIKEMFRVLKSDGRFMVLETGSKNSGVLSPFINTYTNYIMPTIGGLISGKKSAYNYLSKSSSLFPSGDSFINAVINAAPFSKAEYKKVLGGASYIYKFTK